MRDIEGRRLVSPALRALMALAVLSISALPSCARPAPAPPGDILEGIDFFFDPAETGSEGFEMSAADLPLLAGADFSRFSSLRTVVLMVTENPDALDAEKEATVAELEAAIPRLEALKGAPAFECLVVDVGERLFIRAAERLGAEKEEEANLSRAMGRLGKALASASGARRVYYRNWAW